MPAYVLSMRPRARRALRQLDPTARQAIVAAIDALMANPRPSGAAPIKGHRPYLRVRVGDYRVIYDVMDSQVVILVLGVGHRREIYTAMS